MPSMTIRNDQKAYLERTARQLSEKLGTKVTPTEVLQQVLDLCIRDEAVYEPRSSSPVKPETREIYVAERSSRSQAFTLPELLANIRFED